MHNRLLRFLEKFSELHVLAFFIFLSFQFLFSHHSAIKGVVVCKDDRGLITPLQPDGVSVFTPPSISRSGGGDYVQGPGPKVVAAVLQRLINSRSPEQA